ncbi:MAG: hypothetical protein AAGA61_05855, partial [Pseudomonadota bacterium]
LADLYDPAVPAHENPAYVARTREIIAEQDAIMRDGDRVFGSRIERGWVPPTLKDVETAEAEAEVASQQL